MRTLCAYTDNSREVNKNHSLELRAVDGERDWLSANRLPSLNALPHLRLYLLPQAL